MSRNLPIKSTDNCFQHSVQPPNQTIAVIQKANENPMPLGSISWKPSPNRPVGRKPAKFISLLLAAALLLSSAGCSRSAGTEMISGFYFDTFITITLYKTVTAEVRKECLEACETYENLFSATVSGSDIYRINHAQGESTEVSEETVLLLKDALEYAALTDGACDPTIYPASSLWDFTSDEPSVPSEERLSEAVTHIGYQGVFIEGNTVTLSDPEAAIDLGFIAKGYIADRLKELLLAKGYSSGVINLGGNILAFGEKPNGSSYRIGIEYPFDAAKSPILTLELAEGSVVTSGTYQRYIETEDGFYHHILDAGTGYPVDNSLYSVTIIGPSSTVCDALSTSAFLCGAENGLKLINDTEGYEAIFITSDYEILYSDGAESYVSN